MIVALTFAVALVLLYLGGESLVRGASSLAARLGVSRLAVGLTVVAFGTSAPELAVSLRAALRGAGDIAIGNVVGSNIANLTLILGLAALARPVAVEARLVRRDVPIMVAASALLVAALLGGVVSRLEGAGLAAGLVAFVTTTLRLARGETAPVRTELAAAAPERPRPAAVAGGLVIVGLVALAGGGHLLIDAAVTMARSWGVSEATIGLTVVAVGTSLPELGTSLIAARRGQGDIAIGNVIGSNIFNVLGIMGVTAVVQPLRPIGITWLDLGLMLALGGATWLMAGSGRRVDRLEGAALVAIWVGYTWLLIGG